MKEVFLPQTDIGRWMSITDFPNEIWKDVLGFEDAFQVSNLGRIKRKAFNFNIFNGVNSFRKAHILKPQLRVGGYYHVSLSYKGKVYTKLVHRLVAMAFIPNPYNLPQVNHKDENPSNNCVDNLEWCDQKYNSNYGTNGQRISSKLTNGLRSKVVEQYDRKGNFIKEFPSVAEVSRLLGFPTSSITRCCNGSKKYSVVGGYQWKYKGSDKQILNLPTINKYLQDGTLICSYNSVTEASEDTGVHHSSICQCFTGKKKSAGGFIWKKEL